MLIITDSSLYLFPLIAEKSGIKIDSVVDFPLTNTAPLFENNTDILILNQLINLMILHLWRKLYYEDTRG